MNTSLNSRNLLLTILFVGVSVQKIDAQTWTYKESSDTIDGKYKTSMVIGESKDIPFKEPVFVINVLSGNVEFPNIYLTQVPKVDCNGNQIRVSFDAGGRIYIFNVTSDRKEDAWFLHLIGGKFRNNDVLFGSKPGDFEDDEYQETVREDELQIFLREIKAHSIMFIHLRSRCLKYDCSWVEKAINFVLEK